MSNKLSNIIDDYQKTIARVLNLLKKNFGEINYNLAKNTGQIPKTGFLDSEKKVSYNLHGAGITVDFEDISIVFDFDFNSGNHFEFNAWQLARFTTINSTKYFDLSELEFSNLESLFGTLISEMKNRGKLSFNANTKRYYINNPIKF